MVLPRHVLCVLGEWKSLDGVEHTVTQVGGTGFALDREYSQLEHDPRMPRAFAASADRVAPSMNESDLQALERHRAVAYVLSPPVAAERAQAISQRTLAVAAALLEAGALAVKGESSGIAHGAARWRELAARSTSSDKLEQASALHRAWVRRPLGDDGLLYTCGMHLLGARDIEVRESEEVHDDIGWLDLLALYLLAELPERGIREGEGFRQAEGGERRILHGVPCTRYPSDDFFFNPYGYWRLEAES